MSKLKADSQRLTPSVCCVTSLVDFVSYLLCACEIVCERMWGCVRRGVCEYVCVSLSVRQVIILG